MKSIFSVLLVISACSLYGHENQENSLSEGVLDKYKTFLEKGTYEGFDSFERPTWREKPKSRHYTFSLAFKHFEDNNGKIIVELGTTHSFTHGGLPGCNQDWPGFWTPKNPENWDWGAGSFTRMAAECLGYLNPVIYTIDLEAAHIARCKIITQDFASIMRYHVCSSEFF
jgi:hypothetical protein